MDVKKIKVRSQDRYEWKRRTVGEKTVHIIACIILGIFAASYVIAFVWGVLSGAKSHRGVVVYPFEFPGPDPWQWTNYIEVFSKLEVRGVGFIGMVSNTLLMVAASPLLSLGGTAMFAFLALAGDLGAMVSPAMVGSLSEMAGGDLKTGLLAATGFPVVLVFGLLILKLKVRNTKVH